MDFSQLTAQLNEFLRLPVFQLEQNSVTVSTVVFLVVSFSALVFVSRKIRYGFTQKYLEERGLEGSWAHRFAILLHTVLILAGLVFIIDRSELDVTALQILQVVDHIMAEPLIPIGKTNVTLWTVVYILVLSIILAFVTGKVQHWVVDKALKESKIDVGIKYGVSTLAKYAVLALGFLVILQSAGIDLSSLTIIAGALGLGLSFGLQSIVANFVSGFTILLERHVKVGDRIEVDGVAGNITKIKLRSTTVRTNDHIEIIIPNSEFITGKVKNLSYSSKQVRYCIPVGVSYKSDPRKVKEIVEEVALNHKGVLKNPAPDLIFVEYGESSLNFLLRVWTKDYMKFPENLRSELLYEIFDALKENGVEIPFPQRDLHLKTSSAELKVLSSTKN